eukprot:14139367-Alexandrium_andersonii.AAC.1
MSVAAAAFRFRDATQLREDIPHVVNRERSRDAARVENVLRRPSSRTWRAGRNARAHVEVTMLSPERCVRE